MTRVLVVSRVAASPCVPLTFGVFLVSPSSRSGTVGSVWWFPYWLLSIVYMVWCFHVTLWMSYCDMGDH